MNQFIKRGAALLLAFVLLCSLYVPANAAGSGYTDAQDVVYVTQSGTIVNWGYRGETATFLSKYAESFYTGSNAYDTMSQLDGSNKQNSVPQSALYAALQTLMVSKHKHQTTYGETRDQYAYTDCQGNDDSTIISFYSGQGFDSKWDSGATWNREHVWPASKSLSGRPGNGDAGEGADIMMLRPTLKNENGSRGNTAFGLSSGYYTPKADIRGDVARILLYTYVRWGNSKNMWGKSGVIESMNVLLQWMEEDPVDTWEMGRNDAVQSITGTRNVFVDYPEYAWLLFGKEIPSDYTTPSGEAKNGGSQGTTTPTVCTHSSTKLVNKADASCTAEGYTGDTICTGCGKTVATGSTIPVTAHKDENKDFKCDVCAVNVCKHPSTQVQNAKDATCSAEGYTGDTVCVDCGATVTAGQTIAMAEHTATTVGAKEPTCNTAGYTGDTVCSVCNAELAKGETIQPTHDHAYGQWTVTKEATTNAQGAQERKCSVCGASQSKPLPRLEADYSWIYIILAAVAVAGISAVAVILIRRNKKS